MASIPPMPVVPSLNLTNIMVEKVTVHATAPAMVEKVTMDRGSSKPVATVGIVAQRKQALQASSLQNSKTSDVLGFSSVNEKESSRQITELKSQLAQETTLRQAAQEEVLTERKARELEARKPSKDKPRPLREMRADLYDRVQRSSAAMRHQSTRKKERQQQHEADMASIASTPRSPRTPRQSTRNAYSTPVCSPSMGREERGQRTPGYGGSSRSMAPGHSVRAPWGLSQPRKQHESVSLCTWTQAHSEIARSRSIRLGIQKKTNKAALPVNAGMPPCSFYKRNGYCNAFEARGRCAFSHEAA